MRESAKTLDQINCIEDSINSLENALSLALSYEHNDTVTILLDLCNCYQQNRLEHKAIRTLKEFVKCHADLCGPDVYLRLASLLLKKNKIGQALDVIEKCSKFHEV